MVSSQDGGVEGGYAGPHTVKPEFKKQEWRAFWEEERKVSCSGLLRGNSDPTKGVLFFFLNAKKVRRADLKEKVFFLIKKGRTTLSKHKHSRHKH